MLLQQKLSEKIEKAIKEPHQRERMKPIIKWVKRVAKLSNTIVYLKTD